MKQPNRVRQILMAIDLRRVTEARKLTTQLCLEYYITFALVAAMVIYALVGNLDYFGILASLGMIISTPFFFSDWPTDDEALQNRAYGAIHSCQILGLCILPFLAYRLVISLLL